MFSPPIYHLQDHKGLSGVKENDFGIRIAENNSRENIYFW